MTVWLELGKPREKKILVCVAYREWQFVNQPDDSSLTVSAQLERWVCFLEQWERAISLGAEILVTGDMNLNFLNWHDDNISAASQTYKLRSLILELFNRIIPHGFVQVVSVATRVSSGHEPSGLDHVYSNFPEKLSEVQVKKRGSSDHSLIFVKRFTRSPVINPRIIRKRSYKNFNSFDYRNAVRNTSWWDVYSCENVDEAVQKTSEKLKCILDLMAPIRTFQVRKKYAPWMSQLTSSFSTENDGK